ncbi:MAG: hypothetical protein Q7R33_02835 [Nitrosarchaeum sp.]|nr:hypothetical protein [Nitrosarchaeum sp.]
MKTKTKALDADKKPLRINEPIYFFVRGTGTDNFVLFSNVLVRFEADNEKDGYYGCCLYTRQKDDEDYVSQCWSSELSTRQSTAIKLLKRKATEHYKFANNELKIVKDAVDNCKKRIEKIGQNLAAEITKLMKAKHG